MKKIIITALLFCTITFAATRKDQESTDFVKMEQILRAATAALPDKDYRVVLSVEGNLESLSPRHWVATVQKYPADYKTVDDRKTRILFNGPPCYQKLTDFCTIKDIPGEPLFRGRFDLDSVNGHFHRFEGNIVSTASKMAAFREQLKAHPEWMQADIATALASAGARFGPDKQEEFTATLKPTLETLEKAFGPMRLHHVSWIKPDPTLIGWPAYWKVVAIPLRSPKDRLVMCVEPFDGELQQLFVTGLFRRWDSKAKKFTWEYLDPDEK